MKQSLSRWVVESLVSTDVVVIGAHTGAVTAALESKARGLSVRVVSDLTHLASDTASELNLWADGIDRSDPVVARLYPDAARAIVPMHLKRTLESLLLEAQIPFLYSTRPVAILRDPSGAVGGLLLASRSSVFAVRCATVIDASRFGIVARLANVPIGARRESTLSPWRVIADRAPRWNGAERVGSPIELPLDKSTVALQTWALPVSLTGVRRESTGHALHAKLADAAIRLSAESVPHGMADAIAGTPLASSASALSTSAWAPVPGVLMLNSLLPLDAGALAELRRPDSLASLGRHVAGLVRGKVNEQRPLQVATGSQTGDDRITAAFLRQKGARLEIDIPSLPVLDRVDVAIAGGGTGGAPAGIGAARAGAKTVVLEAQSGLGGVGTLGLIASYWFGNKVGFTAELDALIEQLDPDRKNKSRWNPELKMNVYHKLLADAGGEAWTDSFAFGARMSGDRAAGLLVSTPWGAGVLEAGCVVDATGNADVAAASGAPTKWIGADHVACQGTGLSPRNPAGDYCNSDHTFIDDTDPEGVTHALVNARAKFTTAFDVSPLVDSRERRQIVGDIELSPLDILAGRTFPDTMVTASSNFDTHGFTIHPLFFILAPDKKPLQAHVPFRAMLPRGLDGVLVTGLGTSAHRDALPVIRMQADVQNQGFAAGRAAAVSARDGTPLRKLDTRALQKDLVQIGNLAADVPVHTDSFPLDESIVQSAVRAGPNSFYNAAVLFAHFDQAQPLLQNSAREGSLDAALVLGLMGDGTGLKLLINALTQSDWDTGWNYTGMGQFGMSSSRMDAIVLSIGRVGDPSGVEAIEQKIRQLTPTSHFSHCRAVAIASAALKDARLSRALLHTLQLPSMTGHAHLDSARTVAGANPDTCETHARNVSLRELYLARGLYLCGDIDGMGERILRTYTHDLRGQFARHALAVLNEPTTDRLAWA